MRANGILHQQRPQEQGQKTYADRVGMAVNTIDDDSIVWPFKRHIGDLTFFEVQAWPATSLHRSIWGAIPTQICILVRRCRARGVKGLRTSRWCRRRRNLRHKRRCTARKVAAGQVRCQALWRSQVRRSTQQPDDSRITVVQLRHRIEQVSDQLCTRDHSSSRYFRVGDAVERKARLTVGLHET